MLRTFSSKGKKLIKHLIEAVIEKCLQKAKDRIINACSEAIIGRDADRVESALGPFLIFGYLFEVKAWIVG